VRGPRSRSGERVGRCDSREGKRGHKREKRQKCEEDEKSDKDAREIKGRRRAGLTRLGGVEV
jgi:hypothetical protein